MYVWTYELDKSFFYVSLSLWDQPDTPTPYSVHFLPDKQAPRVLASWNGAMAVPFYTSAEWSSILQKVILSDDSKLNIIV